MPKIINTTKAPAAIGPYVQAVDTGSLVFLSGQIPVNPQSGEIPTGVEEQTLQALENVKSILTAAGLAVRSIVKATVFVQDLNNFSRINAAYEKFFSNNGCSSFPARSCIEVARIPKDVAVEIEVVALR